jgi:hypothetical protein
MGNVPLDMLLEDTMALIKKPIDKSVDYYKSLITLMPVRKRLVTAEDAKDLHITDNETIRLANVYNWLKNTFHPTAQQTA